MFEIDVQADVRRVSRSLDRFAERELPFAAARALTELAREIRAAEVAGMERVFDKPKPFTTKSVRVFGATKESQTAGVFVMDRAARYLSPFEDGGDHFLNPGQTKLHVPVQSPKDSGGNVPRNFERSRQGAANVFFGTVRTNRGPINGMWQRTTRFEVRDRRGNIHSARTANLRRGYTHTGRDGKPRHVKGLKLLVRYVGNQAVRQHLDFFVRAERLVYSRFDAVFGRELGKAIASARARL